MSVVRAALIAVMLALTFAVLRAQEKQTPEQQIATLTAQLQAEKDAHHRDVAVLRYQLSQCELQASYVDLVKVGCSINTQGQMVCRPTSTK